jgi:hypothetical protein
MSIELREEARRREREAELLAHKRERFGRDLRELSARPEGRRIFRWLLEQGRIFRIDCGFGRAGAFQAGERAQALRLWRALRENLAAAVFADIILAPDASAGEREEGTSAQEAFASGNPPA